jgi:hypothetical protein
MVWLLYGWALGFDANFLGGVSILFKPQHEAVRQNLRELGKEIKTLDFDAVVLTCGEFPGESDTIQGEWIISYPEYP